jgi:hypothetical protein
MSALTETNSDIVLMSYTFKYILILSSHMPLGSPSDTFPTSVPTEIVYVFLIYLMDTTSTYPSRFIHLNFIKFIGSIKSMSAHCEFSIIFCFFLTNIVMKYQCSFIHQTLWILKLSMYRGRKK